jgi:putative exporter of polyketide antibiotics
MDFTSILVWMLGCFLAGILYGVIVDSAQDDDDDDDLPGGGKRQLEPAPACVR